MRGKREYLEVEIPIQLVRTLRVMAEEREMTMDQCLAELLEIGLISLRHDRPALDTWKNMRDPMEGIGE